MIFSRGLKSSTQSAPSPDGAFIATLFPTKLSIRETRSLEVTRVISLPPELSSSVSWFLWSKSSNRLLLASAESIRVYSAIHPQFSAAITNPTSGTTRVVYVTFGSTDDEICVFAEFGLKLSIIDLRTSKSVDINAPKFFNPATANKGFAYRPGTKNLALLTRHGGRDVVSLHTKENYEVTRSWHPDTVDAQGLSWSPDGRWLVVWESSAQGHKALVYTADGHLFKAWNGPIQMSEDEVDTSLGAGIKLFDWAKTGTSVAIGDYSRRVSVLAAPWFKECMNFVHTPSVSPAESLQVWQEQVIPSQDGAFAREFTLATQKTYLPTSESSVNNNDARSGTNILSFDNSGTLLATRTESMPTVIWIWDTATRILQSMMVFHSPVVKVTWHPSIDKILLIRCEGEDARSLVHIWGSSFTSPKIVDFAKQMVGGKVIGKTIARWLNVESACPAMYFSDAQDCILASVPDVPEAGGKNVTLPWMDATTREFDIYGQQEESPLSLVPAAHERYGRVRMDEMDEGSTRMSGGSDEIEDTFHFKKFIEPGNVDRGNSWT